MGKYFGTDGFRGEANVTLTVEHAFKVGRFLGWYYGQEHKPRIVIGKDTRRSSYMFEYALVAGLTASGADAYLLHVTTTPSVSYVVRTDEFDCGIMISASHNPFYDNGIKVINGMGCKLEAEVEAKIEASEEYRYIFIDAPPLDLVSDGEKIGSLCDGAILVVASGKVSRGMVQNSIHQLERAGCPLLGIVLNRVEDQRKKNYYQKYGYYASEKGKKK